MSMIERCNTRLTAMNKEFKLYWMLIRNDAGMYVLMTPTNKRIMFPMATPMRVHQVLNLLEAEMRVCEKSRKHFQSRI